MAGAIAGLAASWVMNRYQQVQSVAINRIRQSRQSEGESATQQGRQPVQNPAPPRAQSEESRQQNGDECPSTVKIAEMISTKVARHHLTGENRRSLNPWFTNAFGTLMGVWYGVVLAAVTPVTTTGGGSLYGAVLWLGADEISLAALGIAKNPLKYPLSTRLSALSAHLVYGLSLHTGRRTLLKVMGGEEPQLHDRSRIDASHLQDLLFGEDWPSFRRRTRAVKEGVKKAAESAPRRVQKHVA